jgi:hypothetical protein
MAGKPSAAVTAAKAEWMSASKKEKPAALDLARRYNVAESTIHRARAKWIKEARKLARAAAPRKAVNKEATNG